MAAEQGAAARQVVIDAGAAIKLQRLERFGGELLTTSGVLNEVRDEHARALLKTLPQEIRVRDPLPQDIQYTKQFAKLTGDLGFLSQNDIELIALTVGLQRTSGGKLRERPAPLGSSEGRDAFEWAPSKAGSAPADSTPAEEPQASAPEEAPLVAETPSEEPASAESPVQPATAEPSPLETTSTDAAPHSVEATAIEASQTDALGACTGMAAADTAGAAGSAEVAAPDAEAGGSDSEDGSSAGEWVTPDNVHRFGLAVRPAEKEVRVTCATADYSVQNVLLQMGITPLTFDGYAVRTVKLWGLICRACFHFHRDSQKVFCPKCGNDTVVRVPIVVGEDGQPTVLNNGRPLRRKGSVYSVPKPQGGRGWKPVFAEDELLMGGRDRELRHNQKMAEKERMAKDPFNEDNGARAWHQRGHTSTGKQVSMDRPRVQAGYGRRNPNANNFKFRGGGRKAK